MDRAVRSIALVGFMGVGKTTVGRELARELGREFVDLDAEVSRRTQLSTAEIFEREGEKGFRRRETEALKDAVADPRGLVIGCGGGVVTTQAGRRALKRALVVYLAAEEHTLVRRLSGSSKRPLLAGLDAQGREARIHELLIARRPLYAQAADFAVDAMRPNKEVVHRIIRELGAYEPHA